MSTEDCPVEGGCCCCCCCECFPCALEDDDDWECATCGTLNDPEDDFCVYCSDDR